MQLFSFTANHTIFLTVLLIILMSITFKATYLIFGLVTPLFTIEYRNKETPIFNEIANQKYFSQTRLADIIGWHKINLTRHLKAELK